MIRLPKPFGAILRVVAALIVLTVLAVVGLKLFDKLDSFSRRVTRLEMQYTFLTQRLIDAELARQVERGDAPLAKYVSPAVFDRYLKGTWRRLGGAGVNGSWPASAAIKTKALAAHDGQICAGTLAASGHDAQVWCFNGSQWRQIGGNGLNKSWRDRRYVPFLTSFQGKLFAGVDDDVWMWDGASWNRLGDVGKGCLVYAVEAFGDGLYFGTNNCGLNAFKYDGKSFAPFPLAPPEKMAKLNRQYAGVYTMHSQRDRLYFGTIATYGTAAVFEYSESRLKKIGGDGTNGSWINPGFSHLESFTSAGGCLIATLNRTPIVQQPVTPVWCYDGASWYPVGRSAFPKLWRELVEFYSGTSVDGVLVVGSGKLEDGAASVWALSPDNQFVEIGGHGIRGSWGANNGKMISSWKSDYIDRGRAAEYIYRVRQWCGQIVVGFGDGVGLGEVWAYKPAGAENNAGAGCPK